ncbi:MAG: SDR family NAD(P)-dependent oxidoreductase [bacterium]
MELLAGKKALITGSGRGIGREIALHFARAGADVVLTARNESRLRAVAEEIKTLSRKVLTLPADICQEQQVANLARTVSAEWGALDILVNNAAAFARGNVVDLASSDWDKVINTNLRGAFLVTHYFLKDMIQQQSGTIVMVSSTSGKRADAGGAAYSASKFGLMGLAQSLLYEVRQHNIRVVVVSPSLVDTRVMAYDQIASEGKPNFDSSF